jgi:hypothetical protein
VETARRALVTPHLVEVPVLDCCSEKAFVLGVPEGVLDRLLEQMPHRAEALLACGPRRQRARGKDFGIVEMPQGVPDHVLQIWFPGLGGIRRDTQVSVHTVSYPADHAFLAQVEEMTLDDSAVLDYPTDSGFRAGVLMGCGVAN